MLSNKISPTLFKNILAGTILAFISSLPICALAAKDSFTPSSIGVMRFVDPMIGTAAQGNTIPAVGVPFGMTQWTPQTNVSEEKCVPPYVYTDKMLNGFRGSHWLSGSCTHDYGSVSLMPITGKLITNWKEYQAPFSHKDEISTPYYYRVILQKYDVTTELTATKHCGMMRFTDAKNGDLYVLITPNSDRGKGYIKVEKNSAQIVGYNPAYRIYQGSGQPAGFSGYFVAQFMTPFSGSGTFRSGTILTKKTLDGGTDIGAYVRFRVKKGEHILVRIGTSFTSIAEARKNILTEIPDWSFDAVRDSAKVTWERDLSSIRIFGGTFRAKQVFYTAMYHTMQQPRLFSDVDGSYPVFSEQYQTGKLDKGQYYGDFSMWDIFRAELPLYELLSPERVDNWVRSIILKGKVGGWLPIFPCWNDYTSEMIGDHSIAFVASAFNKGIRDYNVSEAYSLMRQNAFDTPDQKDYVDGKGRRALDDYMKYGYLPLENHVLVAFHKNEQVSRTLEYAFDDYSLATVADSLGHKSDYTKLMKRAMNFRNVFDKASGLMRGRHADGIWAAKFSPDKQESYVTEGTPRQWTFYVPQDIPGLASLMGGRQKLELALDTLFMHNNYNPGNEPDQQAPFLYDFTLNPWKTPMEVHELMREYYTNGSAGLPGNDDAGQISAWYIFAALGFYPVNPVSNYYLLSSPTFPKIVLRLKGSKVVRIITHKRSHASKFIYKVDWNDKPLARDYVLYQTLDKGGTLEFFLGDKPSRWGSDPKDQPPGLR